MQIIHGIFEFQTVRMVIVNDIITDVQFGFKLHHGTRDAIFALYYL